MVFRDRIAFTFDAGHRLLNYIGKCASPHGHTFRVEVVIEGQALDNLGLIMDFGELKRLTKGWVDENWDHGFLLNSQDRVLLEALRNIPEAKIYEFPEVNPSAEAMAETLFGVATTCVGDKVSCIRVWESDSQFAEFVR